MPGSVTITFDEHIATIEFYHPKGNSLPGDLLRELADVIKKAGEDDQSRVIVLQSKGNGAFCAGASFDELMRLDSFSAGRQFFSGFANVISAMKDCPKFIIGKIQGKAVGGGVGLIAACDYCYAVKEASVKLSELNLGIGPFVIAPAVERKIGVSALSTLCINASAWRTAEWAHQHGLYNEVCGSAEELSRSVTGLAEQLAKSSPHAMKEIKAMLWSNTENLDEMMQQRAELSGKLALSDFTKDFIAGFKNRS